MKSIVCTFLILFFSITLLQAQNLSVSTIEFGTDIEDRNIVNVDSVFTSSVERVYCFTQVDGAEKTTTITHVWYYGNEEKARVELPVNGPNWRTWSSKFILENWLGEWSVDILDSSGEVLATKTFRIGGPVADQ
ncbi:DUF2914 domain-containing protein [Aliifodinibius sp. S!AR15-10]|uniref:DUF2914 domain-containing protein n=1 Tax=Aliifodinibius sp. S!AR15-10 TaxID=2950437 RepID=UPI0028630E57|nr:DUF2914 domain-containing protein [Aliifodinibius sp. S!AR15-10]MDR8390166.1 DUF2914 domain-containing protein [Aliifodinibius sp. S!AR15-10]